MSATLIIVLLVAAALILFAVEAFVTPGFGVSGIAATACVVGAEIMLFREYGGIAALIGAVIFIVCAVLFLWWVSRSKSLERVSLNATVDGTFATEAQLSVKAGDEGVALTRLALIGNAEIGGKMVEVKSTGEFINEGTPIVVTSVNEALILVKKK